VKTYGADFTFDQFAPMFRAELFDADRWADVIARSGAKYVVLVAKHHDGFALWSDPYAGKAYGRPWNSVETGPKRDIVQELSTAVRKRDMKIGLYYSFFEWFNPLWLNDKPRYVTEHMQPQLRNMITNYKPDLLWADGEWDGPDTFWKSREFLTWLFNESADRNVVVNDRWGNNCRHRHGGFYTTEFAAGMKDEPHAWEENRTTVRPLKYDADGRPLFYQWVVSRSLTLRDYYTPWELIVTLVDTVSRGGNLVLNVGPTADGRILAIQEERLAQIGDWLKVNGEAIFGTKPWRTNCQWSPGERPKIDYNHEWRVRYEVGDFAGRPEPGKASVQAFFTSKGNTLYAIVPRWPAGKLILEDVHVSKGEKVTMLGVDRPLAWKPVDGGVEIEVPPLSVDDLPCRYAYVVKVPGGAR
jgi:alpha-L-fucosidase